MAPEQFHNFLSLNSECFGGLCGNKILRIPFIQWTRITSAVCLYPIFQGLISVTGPGIRQDLDLRPLEPDFDDDHESDSLFLVSITKQIILDELLHLIKVR